MDDKYSNIHKLIDKSNDTKIADILTYIHNLPFRLYDVTKLSKIDSTNDDSYYLSLMTMALYNILSKHIIVNPQTEAWTNGLYIKSAGLYKVENLYKTNDSFKQLVKQCIHEGLCPALGTACYIDCNFTTELKQTIYFLTTAFNGLNDAHPINNLNQLVAIYKIDNPDLIVLYKNNKTLTLAFGEFMALPLKSDETLDPDEIEKKMLNHILNIFSENKGVSRNIDFLGKIDIAKYEYRLIVFKDNYIGKNRHIQALSKKEFKIIQNCLESVLNCLKVKYQNIYNRILVENGNYIIEKKGAFSIDGMSKKDQK